MNLKFGDVLELKNVDLKIKVVGILPAGQPLQLNFSGEKVYNVEIKGRHEYMKQSFLDMLVESQKKSDISSEEQGEQKKRGRPPKIKGGE